MACGLVCVRLQPVRLLPEGSPLKAHALPFAALLLSGTAIAETGRLPDGVVPQHYAITVEPDAKALRFRGSNTITVDLLRPTRTLTLHAADLAIESASVDGRAAAFATDAKAQTLTVTVPRTLPRGRHTLAFRYTGRISQAASGLFALDYKTPDGTPARMLATQFEAPDARRFAPMWDEPALKATFALEAVVPQGETAFSNMPAIARQPAPGGKTRWRFATSPKMSSYLLFFGSGDVERATARAGATEIGVITRRGVTGQGRYALDASTRLLGYFNDYFAQPYPLPKMDMIAGPGSSQFFGAMENWGAILYFEPILLLDPQLQTENQRQDVFNTVAHEMAHQWFGNLVTMQWWDDLWLNEGFATWLAGKVTGDLNPDWNIDAQTAASSLPGAINLDARATTHPIVRPVRTVDEISEAFDGITYQKGAAVIRMLEGAVGKDAFREGVRRYMARHKYGNTTTDDLWREVSAAAGRDVKPMMDSFTRQGGVPLIRASEPVCAGGNTQIALSQSRFALDAGSRGPQTWLVPLNLGGARTPGATLVTVSGAAPVQATVPGCDPLLIVNKGQTSYTRVAYAPEHLRRLTEGFASLPLVDQVGLMANTRQLADSGDATLEPLFAMIDRLNAATDPTVWSLALDHLTGLDRLLSDGPVRDAFHARALRALAPVLAAIGPRPAAGEPAQRAVLREDLLPRMGEWGDAATIAAARANAAAALSDAPGLSGAELQATLAILGSSADAATFDRIRQAAREERHPVKQAALYRTLAANNDPALATRALELALGEEAPVPVRASIISRVAERHPALAFDFAVAHRAAIQALLEESSRVAFIPRLAGRSGDLALAKRVREYGAAHVPAGSGNAVERTAAAIETRAAQMAQHRAAIERWATGR